MSQAKKGPLNYRCPSCFMRDLDIDMFYDEKKKEYYCLRCCYHGSEKEVKALNEMAKYRYKDLLKRVVSFNADDEPITFKEHKKGEQ
jgi:Zn ribbon nucleic-acid-binding protein